MLSCVSDEFSLGGHPRRPLPPEELIVAQRTTTKTNRTNSKSRTANKSLKVSAASKAKTATKKSARSIEPTSAGDEVVTIDRRRKAGRREEDVQAVTAAPVVAAPKLERRKKVNRRRQIDPTTCERDYTDGEVEFMNALDDYKRTSGRMFPTCSEVLEVIRSLGYVKLSGAELAVQQEQISFVPPTASTASEWTGSEDSLFADEINDSENE
jgi:hypothetical protein